MDDLKNCEMSDEARQMETLRKMRFDWYIAPYYGSKEQYLFARCQDCDITGGYSEVTNFGEVKNVKTRVSTRNGTSVRVYIDTDSGEHYCAWIYARCSAFSEAGKKMVDDFDTWRADPDMTPLGDKDYPEENIGFHETEKGILFEVDMGSVDVIKDVRLRRNGKEVNLSIEKRCASGHLEMILRGCGNDKLLVKDGVFTFLSGLSDRVSCCIRNSGRNKLIVDSGFHYYCGIAPGEEREIDPKNGLYREQK
ncbi:MAG: hypothetical protein LUG91_05180 [Ruminococcus sp.]|nr:hypothetical protein [Ruminococcus sp.]